jgi:LmbE family N-acetylglucosaminyl deacetylase
VIPGVRQLRRVGLSRPPVGAAWGWVQTVAGRTATDALLAGAALVLSPHQDDETIGCGLLMAEKANRGIPVSVAVATDGRRGWYSSQSRPAPDDIAEIRHHEWHRALDLLGVSRTNRWELNLPDGELHAHESELVDRIGDLLRSVRPSQVFVTRPGDPNPDHRTLTQAVHRAVAQNYVSDPGAYSDREKNEIHLDPLEVRPQVFTYRVYPGEGLWPVDRPSRITVSATVSQFARSVLGLTDKRPLLFRAPGSVLTKTAAINAYDSQRRLLGGELSFVWGKSVELYWPMELNGSITN